MDTQRLILLIIFSFSLLMLWEAWQKENRPTVPAQQAQPAATGDVPAPAAAPPKTGAPAAAPTGPLGIPRQRRRRAAGAGQGDHGSTGGGDRSLGGDIVRIALLRYNDSLDSTKRLVLLGPDHRYTAQSGLIGQGLPNHRTQFTAAAREFKLADGQDTVEVKLEAATPEGVRVVKTLTFRRGSYVVDIAQEIFNATREPISTQAYFHLTRDAKSPADDKAMLQTFTGPAVYTEQDKFVKVSFSDIDKGKAPYTRTADNGWVAMVQHYFVSALLPRRRRRASTTSRSFRRTSIAPA